MVDGMVDDLGLLGEAPGMRRDRMERIVPDVGAGESGSLAVFLWVCEGGG
jgi:hypothetical protein